MSLAALVPLVALPWLQGFFAPVASSDRGSHACEDDDVASPMSMRADVARAPGIEGITASFAAGVTVTNAAGRTVAHAPGLLCEGSADELIAIAAGDGAIGVPLIVLAATTGGHNENTTSLTLYRVATTGELQPVFVGDVERHLDQTTRTGVVTLLPGGLIYRDPDGVTSLWTYDATAGRYTEQLTTGPSA